MKLPMKLLFLFLAGIMELTVGAGVALLVYFQFAAHFSYGLIERILLGAVTLFFFVMWLRGLQFLIVQIRDLKDPGSKIWAPDRSTRKKNRKK